MEPILIAWSGHVDANETTASDGGADFLWDICFAQLTFKFFDPFF